MIRNELILNLFLWKFDFFFLPASPLFKNLSITIVIQAYLPTTLLPSTWAQLCSLASDSYSKTYCFLSFPQRRKGWQGCGTLSKYTALCPTSGRQPCPNCMWSQGRTRRLKLGRTREGALSTHGRVLIHAGFRPSSMAPLRSPVFLTITPHPLLCK